MKTSNTKRLKLSTGTFLAGLILAVCSSQSLAVDDTKYSDLNADLLDKIVIPAYLNLYQSSIELNQQAMKSCEQADLPNLVSLKQLRTRFKSYVDRWMAIEYFRNGPVEYQFRQNRIQYWPDKHGVVNRQLRKLLVGLDDSLLDQKSFTQLSAGVQGITALEVLLHGIKASDFFTNTTEAGQYRCQFIRAITHNQQAMLQGLVDDWQRQGDGYRNLLLGHKAGSQVPRDIGIDILRLLYGEILAIKELKLGRPLDTSIKKAKPKRAELWRSGLSQSNIQRNLNSVAQFFDPNSPIQNFYNLENDGQVSQ